MHIDRMKVAGELSIDYTFNHINILLGEDNTGKSTFIKLILYALGIAISDFIEKISQLYLCEYISLDFTTKSNRKYNVIRKLPYSDIIIVTPYNENEEIISEKVQIHNLFEYSDFC